MLAEAPRWRVASVALALAALAVALSMPFQVRPPVPVLIGTRIMMAPDGTTVADAMRRLGVRPRPGDLVDVEGVVLRRGSEPGRVLVNGRPARPSTVLAAGDVVGLIEGRDRVEEISVRVVPVPEGGVPNPQSHVGTVPGESVIRIGAVSGKVVSSTFRPSGEAEPPRQVALTFDDGPSPTYTPRIVRILRRFEVPATFFMVGYLAERYPAAVRTVRDSGFAIGNHSMHHPTQRPFAELPSGQIRHQIEEGHAALTRFGIEPVGFRPPGGSWSRPVTDAAAALGERTVLWSVDSEDFHPSKPRILAARVLRDAARGSIILLHDGGGNRAATVRALPRIINGLRRAGLEIVGLG